GCRTGSLAGFSMIASHFRDHGMMPLTSGVPLASSLPVGALHARATAAAGRERWPLDPAVTIPSGQSYFSLSGAVSESTDTLTAPGNAGQARRPPAGGTLA